jgi:hypothetical protein
MCDAQLELSLDQSQRSEAKSEHPRESRPAIGWFAKIRKTVDRIFNREALRSPRPEQIWLSEAHRTSNSQLI